jgi:hypothetical protein
MGSVGQAFAVFVVGLSVVDDEVDVLTTLGQVLAEEIDSASCEEKPKSVAGAVRELRAVVDQLALKGKRVADGDGGDSAGGWGAIGAVVGLAEVRDAKRSVKGDSRSSGRGGRSSAG